MKMTLAIIGFSLDHKSERHKFNQLTMTTTTTMTMVVMTTMMVTMMMFRLVVPWSPAMSRIKGQLFLSTEPCSLMVQWLRLPPLTMAARIGTPVAELRPDHPVTQRTLIKQTVYPTRIRSSTGARPRSPMRERLSLIPNDATFLRIPSLFSYSVRSFVIHSFIHPFIHFVIHSFIH